MIVALVPAAGLSRRMGRPKLLLEVRGVPLIVRVVSALGQGGADRVVVVAPPRSQPGSAQILALARGAGAVAEALGAPTEDMRATIEFGLALAGELHRSIVGVLIAPGDSVGMTPSVVSAVVDRFRADPTRIVVPALGARRGHPLALPRDLAWSIRDLSPGLGLNALIRERADLVEAVAVSDPGFADDLDTPEDYLRFAQS